MLIPEKVKIGGHFLDVIKTNDSGFVSDNEIGKTILAKNVIYINKNYPVSRQEEALLHEIIHNCLYDLNEDQNEQLVTRLGTILFAAIQDNPSIFKDGDI